MDAAALAYPPPPPPATAAAAVAGGGGSGGCPSRCRVPLGSPATVVLHPHDTPAPCDDMAGEEFRPDGWRNIDELSATVRVQR